MSIWCQVNTHYIHKKGIKYKQHRHHHPNEHVNLTCHFDQDGQVTNENETNKQPNNYEEKKIGKKRWQETWTLHNLQGMDKINLIIQFASVAFFLFIAFRILTCKFFETQEKKVKYKKAIEYFGWHKFPHDHVMGKNGKVSDAQKITLFFFSFSFSSFYFIKMLEAKRNKQKSDFINKKQFRMCWTIAVWNCIRFIQYVVHAARVPKSSICFCLLLFYVHMLIQLHTEPLFDLFCAHVAHCSCWFCLNCESKCNCFMFYNQTCRYTYMV